MTERETEKQKYREREQKIFSKIHEANENDREIISSFRNRAEA